MMTLEPSGSETMDLPSSIGNKRSAAEESIVWTSLICGTDVHMLFPQVRCTYIYVCRYQGTVTSVHSGTARKQQVESFNQLHILCSPDTYVAGEAPLPTWHATSGHF